MTETMGWKKFMAKIYGLGAAVVIVGALFKLTHWPGATVMLTVGLVTEALIFFFSAFEPLHEEIDWTLAYPELAGLGHGDEIDIPKEDTKKIAKTSDSEALTKFNAMIEKAGETNVFEKFAGGLENLNDKVSGMADITDATLATNQYTESMKGAAENVNSVSSLVTESVNSVNSSVGALSEAYTKSADAINYSTDNLSDAFTGVTQKVAASGEGYTEAYEKLTNAMNVDLSGLETGSNEYNKQVGNLNQNLSALNAIFELQLNEADLDKMMADLQGSVEHSKKYNTEITKLGQKLEALNSVYGNMLTAMNVKID